MEDIPGNLAKEITKGELPRPAKRKTRWTMLFVGDNGRVVAVRAFRGIFFLLGLILVVSASAAGTFYLLYQDSLERRARLSSQLERTREKVLRLDHQRELLTARLMMAEARLEAGESPTPPTPPVPDADPEPEPKAPEPAAPTAGYDLSVETRTPESTAVESPKAAVEPVVEVQDLSVSHDSEAELLKITFLLKKNDPARESVSGHAFVILKSGEASRQESWLTLPPVDLDDGKPARIGRGQYFSISRFKTMKFEKKRLSKFSGYDLLTIYIFSTDGTLLLERELPVETTGPEEAPA